uniref:Wsv025 n=1 Tax=Caenorhabditis tropicalis TaxID=1561998 RepID=A0A1I7T3A8_9PELO
MHHASEKKKRGNKNPQVSVRLNVRPLCANWKPVKRYEYDGECPRRQEAPTEDQLDTTVWKTKNVRTDVVDSIAVVTDPEKKRKHDMEESERGTSGTISRCECASCERADETPTALELSPKQVKEKLILEKKKKLKARNMKRKDMSESSTHPRRRRRQRHSHISTSARSLSTPPPPPPNSVISPESQHHWCKLYEDAHLATKPIDYKKIVTVPGQIGMSDLEPEDPATPPPTSNTPEKTKIKRYHNHRSPNLPIMKAPVISPPSKTSESFYKPSKTVHQPPLVPQPPTQPQSNIVILPAPVDCPPQMVQEDKTKTVQNNVPPPGSNCDSNSSLVYMPSSPVAPPTEHAITSNSKVSMIRKMENLFYSSESNWWFLVALFMLTIFAYRSTMDQYTCYYD